MKILILGGTSFFGKEIADLALSHGNEVSVFSRRAPADGLPLDIKQIRGDRTVEADLARITLDNWDIVVDNICYTAEDARKAIKMFSGKTGLYLMTSSEAVYYLIKDLSSPFRENHTEIFKDDIEFKKGGFYSYACGKLEAETEFLKAFKKESFPVCIVRPPIVIGPNDNTLRAYSYWLRIADGNYFFAPGWGFQKRMVYSKDLARWINMIINSDISVAGEIFNLADKHTLSLGEFLSISADIIAKPLKAIPADFEWLKENKFNMSASPFSSKKDYIMDISKAQDMLKIESVPVRDWLNETIKWYFFDYNGIKPENYAQRNFEIELCAKWNEENR